MSQSDLWSGVETIWAVWGLSVGILLILTVRALNQVTFQKLRRLLADEDGAAYTLSYVMVMPIYVLFMCLVLETTFMLVAKIGTVYSAYAAARTGIVWYSATDDSDAAERVRLAAARAFGPFASGLAGIDANDVDASASDLDGYVEAYNVDGTAPRASERYVRAMYRYAEQAVDVTAQLEVGRDSQEWDENLTATVAYSYPFNVAGIGRILGELGPDGRYIYHISSNATLQVEHPRNDEKRVGISYASPE